MNTLASQNSPRAGSIRVALLTSDSILALDIGEALRSAGYHSCFNKTCDVAALKDLATGGIKAAIVDLKLSDARSNAVLPWLAAQGIPTVVISSSPEVYDRSGGGRDAYPNVIARFAKPFVVDEIVPRLVSVSKPVGDASEASRCGAEHR